MFSENIIILKNLIYEVKEVHLNMPYNYIIGDIQIDQDDKFVMNTTSVLCLTTEKVSKFIAPEPRSRTFMTYI